MSQENVEIVRRSFSAWSDWDLDAIRGRYADDAVIQTPVTGLGTTFEGGDPIGRWLADLRETWAEVRWEIDRIFETDDVVVTFYRGSVIGRESGIEVTPELTGVYCIRDGKIASQRIFLDRSEALEAAGLQE